MTKRTTITLYEIRLSRQMGSDNSGSKKLRIKSRATKLCRYLTKRHGIKMMTHPWTITPTQAEWATLHRMGV